MLCTRNRRFFACCATTIFALSALMLGSSCSLRHTERKNIVSNGVADVRLIDFTDSTLVRLNGPWHFWEGELLDPFEVSQRIAVSESPLVKVPSAWDKLSPLEPASSLSTGGTIALEIFLPEGTQSWSIRIPDVHGACAVFINGQKMASIGAVSEKKSGYYPDKSIETPHFSASDGKVLLVLQLSNFSLPQTGTWDSPILGTARAINSARISSSVNTSLTSGAMLFMGLYHLALYLLRRKDKSLFVFALICIFMATRNMMMGERLLMDWFFDTEGGWRAAFVIEHLSVHMCVFLFFVFFKMIFPSEMGKTPVRIVFVLSLVWAVLQLFTPPMISHRFLSWAEIGIFFGGIWILSVNIRALIARREGALIIIAGMVFMVATATNDILLSNGIIEGVYLASFGMFAFIFSQSFFLSRRFANLFIAVERYVGELVTLNTSLERFIPKEMLNFLGKKTIVDIHLGDFIEAKMSVFFLDIRNFTGRSETMTPEENFHFINVFLEQFGPIVRNYGGFIDKYLGDGFMALFPGSADNALKAALMMRGQLEVFNRTPFRAGDEVVRFGIGIHTGFLMLGTIGENLRMDTTVISDTVNTASRLEQLTKTLPCDILLSEETVKDLENPASFYIEKLADEKVKGKKVLLRVHALLGATNENDIDDMSDLEVLDPCEETGS